MRIATCLVIGSFAALAACSSPETPAATPAQPAPAASSAVAPAAPATANPVTDVPPAAPVAAAAPAVAAPSPSRSQPVRAQATASAPTPSSTSSPIQSPAAASMPAAAQPAPAAPVAPPEPVYRDVTIPSGARLSIELKTTVASDTSHVEDTVRGVLRVALTADGAEVVPAGAAVSGSVVSVERSGKVKGRARLALRFTSVTIDEAATRIASASIERVAENTKKEDAAKIGIGAGAGAVIGAIAGGKKGAVVGGTIGAGAGTGLVLATRGDEVQIPAGTTLTTTLTQPLVVKVRTR